MKRILVTGATGHLGRSIVEHLLKLKPSSEIAVLARDPAKAVDLSAKGVEVRRGDYFDLESLKRAFAGVGKLMFVSTVTFTDGLTQHRNVVAAAKAAGVEHVHYTSIQHREGSNFVISELIHSSCLSHCFDYVFAGDSFRFWPRSYYSTVTLLARFRG